MTAELLQAACARISSTKRKVRSFISSEAMVKLSLFRHAWVLAAIAAAVLTRLRPRVRMLAVRLRPRPAPTTSALSARITSPMGRTGEVATVRFVAQIKPLPDSVLSPVQFFVDGKLLATINAPPYATDWVDENPFIDTELTISVADNLGHTASDKVVLKGFEITDLTEVSRVLLDTMVLDKDGGLFATRSQQLHRARRRCAAGARSRRPGSLASDVCHVGRQQPEHVTADRLRPRGGNRLVGYMRPKDRMLIVPFSKKLEPITGPTDDRATVFDAISKVQPRGGRR